MAAELMKQALEEGAIVHTNLDIVPAEWIKLGYQDDEIVQLGEDIKEWVPKVRPGAEGAENVVIIDEGALAFNSQDWGKAKDQKRQVFEFMVFSRKLGLDVYFISQHEKNIDVQLRRMTQAIIVCVKAKDIRPFGFIFAALLGDFCRHYKDANGSQVYEKKWSRFDPAIGRLYRTESTHGKFADVQRDVRRRVKRDASAEGVKRKTLVWVSVVVGCGVMVVSVASRLHARFVGDEIAPLPAAPVVEKPVIITRVETPELPKAVEVVEPSRPKEPRFIPRSGQGRNFKGRRYVDVSGQTVYVGSVFRDALVEAIVDEGVIVTIVLDDGNRVRTRPWTRNDPPSWSQAPTTPKYKNPTLESKWKN